MIKCRFCQTTYVNNTIFCSECGNYLLEDNFRDTEALDSDEIGWVDVPKSMPKTAEALQTSSRILSIRLKIGAQNREVEMPLEKITYVMGRVDPISNVFPEIDLSNDGALAKSVSRRHARILKQNDSLFIEDLGSINGTFINGKKLDPYLPEILNDGDRLQLGKLPIEVKIRRQ